MSIETQAAGALKWTGIARLTTQLLTWCVTLFVIRVLAPDDYADVAIGTVIISLLASIAELGLGAALIQARHAPVEQTAQVFGAVLVLNFAAAVLVVVFAPLIAEFFHEPRLAYIVAVSALTFPLSAFATIPEALAIRAIRFKTLALADIAAAAVASLSALALAISGAGVWTLVASSLLGQATRMLILASRATWIAPNLALHGIRRQLQFGGALTASRLSWQASQQMDILIGGRLLSADALGCYAVALQLARLPMQKLMSMINQVAFTAVARLQDERERFRNRLLAGTKMLAALVVPTLAGVSAVAPEFVEVVLGTRWQAAVVPLQLTALAIPMQMLANITSTALTGLGRADIELRNMIVSMCVMCSAFLLGAQQGAAGLAAAWLVGVPVAFLLNFPRTSRELGISGRAFLAAVRTPLLASAAMYAVVSLLRTLLAAQPEWLRLVLLVLAGAASYVLVITVLERRIWTDLRALAVSIRQN